MNIDTDDKETQDSFSITVRSLPSLFALKAKQHLSPILTIVFWSVSLSKSLTVFFLRLSESHNVSSSPLLPPVCLNSQCSFFLSFSHTVSL